MAEEHAVFEHKKPSPITVGLGLVAGLVGWLIGHYAWMMLWAPAAFAAVAGWLLSKCIATRNKPMVFACAVQLGHVLWIVLGLVLMQLFKPLLIVEIGLLMIGVAWLAVRPSLVNVGLLTCFQLAGTALQGLEIAETPWGTIEHRALTAHLSFRVLAIVSMVIGLVQIRKATAGTNETGYSGSSDTLLTAGFPVPETRFSVPNE